MVTYITRLKKGVVITPYRILKYPSFVDDVRERFDNPNYDMCEMTLSFEGIESAMYSFNIIIDGVDEI